MAFTALCESQVFQGRKFGCAGWQHPRRLRAWHLPRACLLNPLCQFFWHLRLESKSIGNSGRVWRVPRAALIPLSTGIVISRKIKPGFKACAFSIASGPIEACPQTSMSRRELRMPHTPFRTASCSIGNEDSHGARVAAYPADLIKAQLHCVQTLAISLSNDTGAKAKDLSESYSAVVLPDKMTLFNEIIPAIMHYQSKKITFETKSQQRSKHRTQAA